MYDKLIPYLKPRKYAVEAGKFIEDEIVMNSLGTYNYSLHGPNGWVR